MRIFSDRKFNFLKDPSSFSDYIFFVPAALFFFTSFIVLLAPNLVISIISTLSFVMGVCFIYLGIKLINWKRTFTKIAKEFDGKVIIQNIKVESDDNDEFLDINKKIFYH